MTLIWDSYVVFLRMRPDVWVWGGSRGEGLFLLQWISGTPLLDHLSIVVAETALVSFCCQISLSPFFAYSTLQKEVPLQPGLWELGNYAPPLWGRSIYLRYLEFCMGNLSPLPLHIYSIIYLYYDGFMDISFLLMLYQYYFIYYSPVFSWLLCPFHYRLLVFFFKQKLIFLMFILLYLSVLSHVHVLSVLKN